MGPLKGRRDERAKVNFIHAGQSLGCTETVNGLDPIQHQLERIYNADFTECTADLKECLSQRIVDHYEIALPWKCKTPYLPDNEIMAKNG